MPLRVDARLRRHIPEVCFGLPCRAQHQPRGCGPGGPGWPLRQAALHGSLLQGQRGPHAQCPVGPRAAPAAGPEPLHPGPGRVAGLQRLRWVGSPSFQHACGPRGVREDTGSAEGCRRCPASEAHVKPWAPGQPLIMWGPLGHQRGALVTPRSSAG